MLSSYFDLRARRLQEERQEERRQEERRQDEERRRQDDERRREDDERRHREIMALLAAALANGREQGNGQSELVRNLRQTIEELRAENDRLRKQNGHGDADAEQPR